jgi:shikimate 5-dehydrogenase
MRSFKQELVAVFGQPVAENPTQAMIEAAFVHHGLEWRYLTIEVAPKDLAAAVAGARAMGFRGFNCTIPHKVAVVEHLDEIARSAELIGAVNTVVRHGNRLVGENTDGRGFVEALRKRRDPAGTLVADVIPNPPRTRFLAEAAERGCEVIDGLEMLVEQGVLGVRLWTGIEPERTVMREALARVFTPPAV